MKRKSFEILFHVTGNCQKTQTVYFDMKTCYYYLVLRPLWGQESTFLLEAKRVCWQDEKEGKANLFCSVFIDSFFTDVVPVINDHSIQFFCSSLCVPKGICSQFVSWNKQLNRKTLLVFQYLSGWTRKQPRPPTVVPEPHVPTETSCQRQFNHWQYIRPQTTSNITGHVTHVNTSCFRYPLKYRPQNLHEH